AALGPGGRGPGGTPALCGAPSRGASRARALQHEHRDRIRGARVRFRGSVPVTGAATSRFLVGISGASGAAFALDFLKRCPGEKYLVVSDWGKALLHDELDMAIKDLAPYVKETYSDHDLASPFASGSNRYDAF